MFKKILIVILILLLVGVLSINITFNTDASTNEEDIEKNTEELEGFTFDNKNVIIEEIRGKNLKQKTRGQVRMNNGSFIKLQGKVKELQHEVYDLKNEIKVTNNSIDNKLKNVTKKDELDNKIKSYQQENKKAFKDFEKNQNDKIKSISLDNKVDKLEDQKRQNAQAKAINDNFRKYSNGF
tara:strand:- start:2502 stop:3044 length:543 start_codon:yes stop_codon:yes gene_type:complete